VAAHRAVVAAVRIIIAHAVAEGSEDAVVFGDLHGVGLHGGGQHKWVAGGEVVFGTLKFPEDLTQSRR